MLPLTRTKVLPLAVALLAFVVTMLAVAADPPRGWPPNSSAPVTLKRISALSATEQLPWKAYWDTSQKLLSEQPAIVVTEYSPSKPISGPSIKALHYKGLRFDAPANWYAGEEAHTIADRVALSQTAAGGWMKGNDYTQSNPAPVDIEGNVWDRGTFDNDATIFEMRFLALVNAASPDNTRSANWRKSFLRGLQYVFAAQYPNGGFPQIYPLAGGYHDNVTFDDEVITHALELMREVAAAKPEYKFVPATLREEAGRRMKLGLQCILATQITSTDGKRTAWAQQYDALTLKPAAARNFEPIGTCTSESVAITKFLMDIPEPSAEIVGAVDDAVAWFRRVQIQNIRWNRFTNDAQMVVSTGAPPMWARLYELNTDKPIFGDRDRTVHYDVSELSAERRAGYGWYGDWPTNVLQTYDDWRKKTETVKNKK